MCGIFALFFLNAIHRNSLKYDRCGKYPQKCDDIYISLTVSTIYSIVITEERYIIRYTYKVWRYISLYFVFRTADTPITMTNSVIVFTPMWLACTWQIKEDFRRILVQIIITLAFSFRLYEELITVFFYVKFVNGYAIKQLVYVLLVNYVHIYIVRKTSSRGCYPPKSFSGAPW